MEWWQILSTLAGIFIAISQFYVWVWPVIKRNASGKKEAKLGIQGPLDIAIGCVEAYERANVGSLEKAFKNAPISKKLYKQLNELVKLGIKYNGWNHEAWQIVNTEISRMAESSQYKYLNESLGPLVGGGLLEAFSGYEGHPSDPIYKAVYARNLTFELARDAFSKRRWDQSATVGGKKITLTDVVDGAQFHRFIEELQQLQNRKSLQMLREVRKTFLENAKPLLKEII